MKDIMKEVEAMVNCKTCKWNQFCIKPPVMTRDETNKAFEAMRKDAREDFDNPEDAGVATLMGMMMLMGKDTTCPVCPGLARRMEEPILSQKIKELMQDRQEVSSQCKACGWEKFCLEPPLMTEEEQKAKIEKLGDQDNPEKAFAGTFIGAMIYGGVATECSACHVFIEELRKSPNLAQQIKKIMQSWENPG